MEAVVSPEKISVHLSTLWRAVHLVGFRLRRTAQSQYSPDEHYLEKVRHLERVLKMAEQTEGQPRYHPMVVLYEDEAYLDQRPSLSRQYQQQGAPIKQLGKGVRPFIRCLFGAVNPVSGATYHQEHRKGAAYYFIEFLTELEQHYPFARAIHVFLDNWSPHAARKVKAFLARHRRIHLDLLPTYAPWLMKQERIWKEMRKCVTHGHPFTTIKQVLAATREFFDDLNHDRHRVLRLIGEYGT